MKHLCIYDDKTNQFKAIDWRVIRNYIIPLLFISTTLFCYFYDKGLFTLKNAIISWLIVSVGWGINFILSNAKKSDDVLLDTQCALNKIIQIGEAQIKLYEDTTNTINELKDTKPELVNNAYQEILTKIEDFKPNDVDGCYQQVKDFYKNVTEVRRNFSKEIASIATLIATTVMTLFLQKVFP